MSSAGSGNESNNSPVDQNPDETIRHELNTLPWDALIGSEEAKCIQSKTKPPVIKDLMVQCGRCHKWRLIPSMEKYEILREKHVENPFVCETASEWKPNMSCDVPGDKTSCSIWAIDVPSIPRPPTGWKRIVKVRREECEKFADVFLNDHPEYIREGVNLSQFSFQLPRPLADNYVKMRTRQVKPTAATETKSVALVSPGEHSASEQGQSSKRART